MTSNLANVSWQNYSLTPTVGYFIADNMMVGMGFAMGSESDSEDMGGGVTIDTKISGMSLSPFFRYYMNDALFGKIGMTITSESTVVGDNFEESTGTFGLGFGVGYSLMWNEKVCIEPSFGIETGSGSTDVTNGSTTVSSDAPSTFNMAIGLGINIRLGE